MSRSPQGRYLISFFNLSIPLYNYLIHITLHSGTLKKYSPFTAYISRKISSAKIHIFFDMEIFFRKNGKKDTLHAFFACSPAREWLNKSLYGTHTERLLGVRASLPDSLNEIPYGLRLGSPNSPKRTARDPIIHGLQFGRIRLTLLCHFKSLHHKWTLSLGPPTIKSRYSTTLKNKFDFEI